MTNEIAEMFADTEYCNSQILEARKIFGDRTTTRKQYEAMEKVMAFGFVYCPSDLQSIFESTLFEAGLRKPYYEKYFWKE